MTTTGNTHPNRKRIVRITILTIIGLLVAWKVSVLWTLVSKNDAPSVAGFRKVPGPSQVREVTMDCGSGGCWREMIIDIKSPQTATSLAAEMGIETEQCGPIDLWTLRKTCTGVSTDSNGEFTVYLRYNLLIKV